MFSCFCSSENTLAEDDSLQPKSCFDVNIDSTNEEVGRQRSCSLLQKSRSFNTLKILKPTPSEGSIGSSRSHIPHHHKWQTSSCPPTPDPLPGIDNSLPRRKSFAFLSHAPSTSVDMRGKIQSLSRTPSEDMDGNMGGKIRWGGLSGDQQDLQQDLEEDKSRAPLKHKRVHTTSQASTRDSISLRSISMLPSNLSSSSSSSFRKLPSTPKKSVPKSPKIDFNPLDPVKVSVGFFETQTTHTSTNSQ